MSLIIILIVAAILIPGTLTSHRAENERNASTSLKTLTSAESDFRTNDRDLNRVNDFWTGDVSGLYYLKPAGDGPGIRLIDESLANADAKPLLAPTKGTSPRACYLFQALDQDRNLKGAEAEYRRDTDKSARKVHNMEIFGFCAYPENESGGKYVFGVNENNTIFRENGTKPWTSWPTDKDLKSGKGSWD